MEIKQINQYEAFHLIGKGIGSAVYKAWDSEKKRQVSAKLLFPNSTINRDISQIFKYANISHPNLCTIHSVEPYNDSILIITDYLDGESLQQKIISSEYPRENLLLILKNVISGLEELYKHDLVHGNLKPSNIIITEDDRIMITDAGLSPFENFQKTPEFQIPYEAFHYLSPEQIENKPASAKSDFFALGVIAYRILTDHLPFEGNNEDELTEAIMTKQPQYVYLQNNPLKEIYSLLLNKFLAKAPADRFVDTTEILATLKEIELFDRNIEEYAPYKPSAKNPRKYLTYTVLAALLLILWFVLTINK